MKTKLLRIFTLLFLALSTHLVLAQLNSIPPSGGNQRSVVTQHMGGLAYVQITYNSPDVAGREGAIWGQLVPYGLNNLGFGLSTAENPSPWRAGANENTTIEFSHDMNVQGKSIPAGSYGFHIIPKESGPWTLIFSSENSAWGSYSYTPEEDVLRVEATPEESPFREYLSYEFTQRKADTVEVSLMWENLSIPFTVTLPEPNQITLEALQSELKGANGFSWVNLVTASGWALGVGYNDLAMQWADAAVNAPFVGTRNFTTLQTKAAVHRAMNEDEKANELMSEAIKFPGVSPFQIHAYGRQLITSDNKEEALEVFKYNHKTNNGVWPTNYGLARGYSALGDYKNALKYLKLAKENVPAGDTINPPVIEANIEKLKKGEDIN